MLRSIDIRNFRSCRETIFDLPTPLCAICGRNGVGKSNVLTAIQWGSSTSISSEPVRNLPWGGHVEDRLGLAIAFRLDVDGDKYRYRFEIPAFTPEEPGDAVQIPGIEESLDRASGASWTSVFTRSAKTIELPDRPEPIQVRRMTPALAALSSLLTSNDPAALHIERVTRFFSGIQYYPLDDRPNARDLVPEQDYNEWKFRFQSDGDLPPSVAMRLIYMHEELPDLFAELHSLLGPDGLDLVEAIEIIPFDQRVPGKTDKDPATTRAKFFMPLVYPSRRMGGFGDSFPFSRLSVGTRRVVKIITLMLFDRRSLMLMEQPEDSIHPGLLRKMIDQLRSYSFNTQIVFTTHSLEVLDILEPEEILLATANGGETEVRSLTLNEVHRAKTYLKNEGALSDYLESLDDL